MRKSAATICSTLIVSLLIQSVLAFEMEEIFPDERNALVLLRDIGNSSSNLHANWTGPTCNTRNQSRWAGVGCSDWHVTHLVLEGIQLSASLPPMLFQNLTFLSKLSFRNNSLHGPLPNLTNLVQLEYVFLSKNGFSGSIPSNYINLPELTKLELQENDISGEIPPFNQSSLIEFNVSNNELRGPIPETPVLQRFSESSYANNSDLCGEIAGLNPCRISPSPSPAPAPPPAPFEPSRKKGGLQPWSIALIAAAAVLVPLSSILICLCYYQRVLKKTKKNQVVAGDRKRWRDDSEITSVEMVFLDEKQGTIFELDDLLRSAAQVMGRGRLGSTYKAMLECGSVVAVKRLQVVKSNKEFVQQMRLIGKIKHQNLAEMISFYHSKQEKLIVYEYLPDGSLFSLLHENRGMGRVVVEWRSRVEMIKEIAKGLEYLHKQGHCHGNLKSSNVLIQGGHGVKLIDYGFLPLAPPHKLSVGRTPEFLQGKKLTTKADVYCFGILLLEIVTGRLPTTEDDRDRDRDFDRDGDLSEWVRAAVSIDWSTDILDLEIVGEKEGYDDMLRLTEIALECTDELPERRPNMTQLLTTISSL